MHPIGQNYFAIRAGSWRIRFDSILLVLLMLLCSGKIFFLKKRIRAFFWRGGGAGAVGEQSIGQLKNWIKSLVCAQFLWISWASIDTSVMKYLCSCPETSFLPSHPHRHPQESYSESTSRSWLFKPPNRRSQSCVFPTCFSELVFWPWRLSAQKRACGKDWLYRNPFVPLHSLASRS